MSPIEWNAILMMPVKCPWKGTQYVHSFNILIRKTLFKTIFQNEKLWNTGNKFYHAFPMQLFMWNGINIIKKEKQRHSPIFSMEISSAMTIFPVYEPFVFGASLILTCLYGSTFWYGLSYPFFLFPCAGMIGNVLLASSSLPFLFFFLLYKVF